MKTLRLQILLVTFLSMLIGSCDNGLLIEVPDDHSGEAIMVTDFRVVSYNIHGGKGPNGEGDLQQNLTAFRDLMQGESIICLQEVEPDCWGQVKAILSDYPYRFYLEQQSTKFGTNKEGGNAILSKFPIESYDSHLVQCDPGGDKWQRKAQYVRIHVGNDHQFLNLFHYHNTYNWHENNSSSEKEGFEKFVAYVNSKELSPSEMNLILGDFNLNATQCNAIISAQQFPNSQSNWVDHIYTNGILFQGGIYNTFEASLSDHQAVWSVLCNDDC